MNSKCLLKILLVGRNRYISCKKIGLYTKTSSISNKWCALIYFVSVDIEKGWIKIARSGKTEEEGQQQDPVNSHVASTKKSPILETKQ